MYQYDSVKEYQRLIQDPDRNFEQIHHLVTQRVEIFYSVIWMNVCLTGSNSKNYLHVDNLLETHLTQFIQEIEELLKLIADNTK